MAKILVNQEEITGPERPARRYGLFDAAVMRQGNERIVASGLQFVAEDCGIQVVPYDATCAPPHPEKTFTPGTPMQESDPYWLIASYQCGTVGTTAEDVRRRVMRRYEAGVQHAVEAQVWSGALGTPSLTTQPGVVTVTPAAAGAGAAIAALEQSFHDAHGYVGTVHMNTAGYAAVKYAGLLDRVGGNLKTPIGSTWSLGAGYGVNGPANVAPAAGFVWAFMTPQVYLWSTPISQPDPVQTLDRTNNQWMALAETVWAHAWLCDTIHAVQVPVAAPAVATAPAVP